MHGNLLKRDGYHEWRNAEYTDIGLYMKYHEWLEKSKLTELSIGRSPIMLKYTCKTEYRLYLEADTNIK